ncbi:hypothetical protein J4573_01165 [Actinomadura barringtoniae]|uniref:Oxidoreductase n=1 Tax=Actinomadura barringtoniae TaxID=1427535 RepID=A0A939T7B0_9ACTN|nr:hypothetical protein [Actinomadura barringtoniae]MBO2445690.1 hypothetical protein [Actinomadura barringtoniae]
MDERDLNEAEQAVWQAYPCGDLVDLSMEQDQTIRATVLAALLLGAVPPQPGHSPGIRLRGARITGRLDLGGATLGTGLDCGDCEFEEDIDLADATLRTLRIEQCTVPVLRAARMRVDGLLSLDGTRAHEIRLEGAQVSGPLNMIGTRAGPIQADNLSVGGRLSAERLTVDGTFSLHNASFGSSLDLRSARLRVPDGIALSGGGLTVRGGVFCWDMTCEGELRLVGARLGANLTMDRAWLTNPGGTVLDLDGAAAGHIRARDMVVEAGRISMRGTQVAGSINLARSTLPAGPQLPDGPAAEAVLAIDNATMAHLALRNVRARGEIMVRSCRVTNRIVLSGAQVHNPGGTAVRLSRTEVGADLHCDGLNATGTVKLNRTRVGGHVELVDVRLKAPGRYAIEAHGLQAGEVSLLPAELVQGTVLLSHAQIGVLRDLPERWPTQLVLSGTRYEALEPRLPASARLRWLTRSPEGYESQPYEQLAQHYTETGQDADARKVLYAKERHRQAAETRFIRVWSRRLQDITTGYGYRPWRAVLWLAVLLAVGGAVFGIWPPDALKKDEAPHFNALVYTLDLLIPIVDLGQEHAFNPDGVLQWVSYVYVAAGWILATTVAAGVARVITRR